MLNKQGQNEFTHFTTLDLALEHCENKLLARYGQDSTSAVRPSPCNRIGRASTASIEASSHERCIARAATLAPPRSQSPSSPVMLKAGMNFGMNMGRDGLLFRDPHREREVGYH